MECHFCGQYKEGLPFRCNYCGDLFCAEHRLPENHACPRVGGPLQPGYARVQGFRGTPSDRMGTPSVRSNRSRFGVRYASLFSKTERKHILVATLLMVLVGLSFVFSIIFIEPLLLVILVPAFALSFLGHELAHKFVARRNGLWAEFRTNLYGLMLTAVSVVLPFKFLAPGQVNIQGNASREVAGAIGLVGPGFSIVVGAAFFVLYKLTFSLLSLSFLSLSAFNGWLAVINLIPFGSLDGTMVFHWDKTRWLIALIGAIALLILTNVPTLI